MTVNLRAVLESLVGPVDWDAERTYVDTDEPNLDDRPTPSQERDMDRAYQRSHQQTWGHSA